MRVPKPTPIPEELYFLLKISYYVFVTPHNCFTSSLHFLSKTFHKLICLLLSLGSFLWLIDYALKIFPISPQNPMSYFIAVLMLLFVIQRVLLLKLLWLEQGKFMKLLDTISEAPSLLIVQMSLVQRLKYFFTVALTMTLMGLKETSEVILIFNPRNILSIVRLIFCTHNSLLDAYVCLISPLVLLRLRSLVSAFKNTLSKSEDKLENGASCWLEISRSISYLQKICDGINELHGNLLTAFIFISVIFLASGIHQVAETANQISKLGNTLECVFILGVICAIYYIAADIPYQMGFVKKWLANKENLNRVSSQKELMFLLNQLDSHSISAKASDYFPITYGLVASVCSSLKHILFIFQEVFNADA